MNAIEFPLLSPLAHFILTICTIIHDCNLLTETYKRLYLCTFSC